MSAKLTPKQREIADLMRDGVERTGREVFEALGGGRSMAGTAKALRALEAAGVLVAEELSPGVPYSGYRYRLMPTSEGELTPRMRDGLDWLRAVGQLSLREVLDGGHRRGTFDALVQCGLATAEFPDGGPKIYRAAPAPSPVDDTREEGGGDA